MFEKSLFRKQPSKGVLIKRCSEKYAANLRSTIMPKRANWNRTSSWVFSCKFAAYYSEHLLIRTPLEGCFSCWYKADKNAKNAEKNAFRSSGKIFQKFIFKTFVTCPGNHPWKNAVWKTKFHNILTYGDAIGFKLVKQSFQGILRKIHPKSSFPGRRGCF